MLQRSNINSYENVANNNNDNWLDSFAGKNMAKIEVILSDSQKTTYFITTEILQRFCDVMQNEIGRVSNDRMNMNAIAEPFACGKDAILSSCLESASQGIRNNMISIENILIGDESSKVVELENTIPYVDTDLSALSLVRENSLVEQSVVAVELLQNDAMKTLFFTKDMWHNFRDIMNRKIGRILATASRTDRMSEINSVMELFSDNWFRGETPISRKSLIWDFRLGNNLDDFDGSASSEGLTNDSTISANSSLDADDFETTVSTSIDSNDFDVSVDDKWLDLQLKKLYNADDA